MRDEIDLNGRWKFYPAFEPFAGDLRWMDPDYDPGNPDSLSEERKAGWTGEFLDDRGWLDITVPGSWNSSFEDLWSYEGHGWYRRRIRIPSEWRNRRVLFHSDGANYRVELFVNGRPAGAHEGGHIPFSIPIDNLLRFGQQNVLAIDCDNIPRPERVPGGQFGWWNHGGLYRDICLQSTARTFIDEVTIHQDIAPGKAAVRILATVNCQEEAGFRGILELKLADPAGRAVALPEDGSTTPASLSPGTRPLSLRATLDNPALWSPSSPSLYKATLHLRSAQGVTDEWSSRIGLRRIEVAGDRLLLNGDPLLVKGLNRHEQYPSKGRSTPTHTESELRHDLDLVRRLGANALRCHYPNHPRLYELCDELGIINMVEMPLWQWGSSVVDYDSLDALRAARVMLEEMIKAYGSHPSIVIWSVSNENFVLPHSIQRDDPKAVGLSERVVEGNKELMQLARKMDPTRPVVEVSNHWPADPAMGSGDILAINAYIGSPSPPLKSQVSTTFELIHRKLQDLRARHPGKPILVTEFGKWTVRGLGTEYPPGEAFQAEKLKAEWQGFLNEAGFVGGFIWCFADYDVHVRYRHTFEYRLGYGIFDLRRRPKAAAKTIRQLWTA